MALRSVVASSALSHVGQTRSAGGPAAWTFGAGLAAILAWSAFRFGGRCLQALRSPFSKDYGEGCVLALVQLLAERGSYFTSGADYPFVHAIYPPVFILLNVPAYLLLGPSLWFPRLLAILSTLGLVVVLAALLVRRTGDRWLASAFGLLFLVPWFVQSWAPLARVDMTACLLSLAGLYLFETLGERPEPARHLPWLVFVLAFLTKQSAILAPAAVLGAMLLDRDRRKRFLPSLASLAVWLAVGFGGLVLATRGEAWRHLFPYTAAAEYLPGQMVTAYRDFLFLCAPLVALIAAGLAAGGPALRQDLVYVVYWALGLASLVTMSKAGAAQNYYLEPYLATLLLAGLAVARLRESRPRAFRAWPAYVLAAAAVAALYDRPLAALPLPLRNPGRALEYASLDEEVRATEGPILSENLSVLVLNRRPVLVEPFGLLLIGGKGYWKSERVVEDCRRGRFALVVFEYRLGQIPGMSACLEERYTLTRPLETYDLYRPR
jgi:hypothetical protein